MKRSSTRERRAERTAGRPRRHLSRLALQLLHLAPRPVHEHSGPGGR